MNKTSLWIVIVVTGAWIGFLFGYAVSSHTGVKPASAEKAAAGGYGRVPAKGAAAGGYGRVPAKGVGQPGAAESKGGR